jgi:surfeit locus 1 family protein
VKSRTVASVRVTTAGVLGSLAALVVAVVCVRLGIWQLHRLVERKALNAAVEARLMDPPLDIATPPLDTVGLLYRRVRLQGTYDNAHAIVIAERTYQGNPGVHLLTPLRLPGGAILVNRGWLPSPDARTVDVGRFDTTGVVVVVGLVRPFRLGRRLVQPPSTGVFQRVWYGYDPTIPRHFPYPVASVYVQALPAATPATGGLRLGPQTLPAALPAPPLSNGSHLSYAIQWFSFALIALVGWLSVAARSGALRVAGEEDPEEEDAEAGGRVIP